MDAPDSDGAFNMEIRLLRDLVVITITIAEAVATRNIAGLVHRLKPSAHIIAGTRYIGELITHPDAGTRICSNDTLLVIGSPDKVASVTLL